MKERDLEAIQIEPIGLVRRASPGEDLRDRELVSQVVLRKELAPALEGIDEWSHIYVIYWLDRVIRTREPTLHFPVTHTDSSPVGVLATRAPIHPNPVGLTLVELVRREKGVLWVRGLDAYDGTPVLDIKPYPDWERGRLIVVTDFRVPGWLAKLLTDVSDDHPIERSGG
jgi:tRNA-Thr(GGU) m(6)t(6)A37 methyltransferase TsaA